MEKSVQLFNSPEFGELETLEVDGKIFFRATQVATILGYFNPRDAILRHCNPEGVVKSAVWHNEILRQHKIQFWRAINSQLS